MLRKHSSWFIEPIGSLYRSSRATSSCARQSMQQHPGSSASPSIALYGLAFGSFAVGTSGFVIAAVLPDIAFDLDVTPGAAGLLVIVYSLAYAVSAPVLTFCTARVPKRALLLWSLVLFAIGNALSAFASSFEVLLGTRVLVAALAGLYMPNANALAGTIVVPERRGRALAIVGGGLSMAIAFGVPLGALLGAQFGWRLTFIGVAAISVIAITVLYIGIPRELGGQTHPVALCRLRMSGMGQRSILTLSVTALWGMGGYTVYPYIALVFRDGPGLNVSLIGWVLFLYGGGACAGLVVGGRGTDRVGASRIICCALPVVCAALLALSASPHFLADKQELTVMLIAVFAWAMAGWAFFPAQQARLIGIVQDGFAPLILSLNTAFQYVGYSVGAMLGGLLLTYASPLELGVAGAVGIFAAIALNLALALTATPRID